MTYRRHNWECSLRNHPQHLPDKPCLWFGVASGLAGLMFSGACLPSQCPWLRTLDASLLLLSDRGQLGMCNETQTKRGLQVSGGSR